MKKFFVLLLFVAISICGNAQGMSKTIHVPKAGTLSNYISDDEKYQIERLTLTGELNSTDFRLLRDMAGNNYLGELTDGRLAVLDISGISIVPGGENYLDARVLHYEPTMVLGGQRHYTLEQPDEIGQYLFACCVKLQHVYLPESVKTIANDSFSHCTSLTSVEIPGDVSSIRNYVFSSCKSLEKIVSRIVTPFPIMEYTFSVYDTATLMVPAGTIDDYKSQEGWKNFRNIVEIEEQNDSEGDEDAFYIYRNDGQFNAFFCNEIDSIGYSHYDATGKYYEENVAQLVYTPDSTYYIPLAVIDSVSFVQPEIILQPNVVEMDQKGLMDYLVAVDGMTLFFSPSIPKDLQPRVGNVLLSTDFDNKLLSDGFAGKVVNTQLNGEAFRVDCDYIYDIFDIFEQLISIEKIEDEKAQTRSQSDGKRAQGRRKIEDEWISDKNTINFELGYKHQLSKGEVSLSGSIDGTYIATVTYNITRKKQYVSLRMNHDWHLSAHLKVKSEKEFGTLFGQVKTLTPIRFPAKIPVFKLEISGVPFVKGEGNMEVDCSLNSPEHSYVSQVVFDSDANELFSGTTEKKPVKEDNSPTFETAFSLNGSLQGGYMVDLWLGFDVFGCVCKLATGLDFYIGPKLYGDFSLKAGTEDPVNCYSIIKDTKIGLDLLHVDYEFFGEAALLGFTFPKGVFCEGSIDSPLNHERYVMPEFSDLSVDKDDAGLLAIARSTPSRNVMFPLELGMGLYDEGGKLLESAYEESKYWNDDGKYKIAQSFFSLQRDKEYEVKPMIKILGTEFPAFPTKKFQIENKLLVTTLEAKDVTSSSATIGGKVEDYVVDVDDGEVGFYYNSTGNPTKENGNGIIAGKLSDCLNGEFFVTLTNLEQDQLYYYRAYYCGNGKYYYGEIREFTTEKAGSGTEGYLSCPDANHPHMIDLGLPSGTLWACCNVGASAPEQYGNYYAWGETQPKSVYDWSTYSHCDGSPNTCHSIGSDIAGTKYDAATANWGIPWQMPTIEQYREITNNCSSIWLTQNGVIGRKFTGPNGGTIFLPAGGYSWESGFGNVGLYGDYWSSTAYGSDLSRAWYLILGYEVLSSYYDYHRVFGRSVRPVR